MPAPSWLRNLLPQAGWLLPLALLFACLGPEPRPDTYIAIKLKDSLSAYDTVQIILLKPDSSGEVIEVIWNGPMPDPASLDRMKVDSYSGGNVVVEIIGKQGGAITYRRRIHYGPGGVTRVDTLDARPPGIPEIKLVGRDTVAHTKNFAYVDSGATCTDPEDGALIPILSGEVLIYSVGSYTLTYTCKDKDGHSAPPRTRTVKVAEAPDVTPPTLTLKGSDSLDHPRGKPYADSGAACVDPRDGVRPVSVAGEVHVQSTGRYVLTYSCQDLAGNKAAPRTRVVRVFTVVPEIPAAKEGHVDTSEAAPMASYGYTPFIRFAKFPGPDPWVSVVQFSLDGLTLSGVTSASGVFRCFLWGEAPAAPDSFQVVFHIDRVKEQWIEGTGNPYYHSGGWQGGGDTILAHHPFRTEILSGSTPITVISGMDKRFKHVVREGNLIPIGKDTVVIRPRASRYSGGDPGVIPAGAELFTVEIDLMEYIRKTDSGNDFGLTIRTEGMPAGVWLGWATKELGDGSFRPKMFLEY